MTGKPAHPDPIQVTVASYDQEAEAYVAATSSYDPFPGLREDLDGFLKGAVEPVLDVGCGAGRDVIYMTERGYEVIAGDMSHGLLSCLPSSIPSVLFDARQTPFRSATIGAIWCCAMLIHVPRLEVGVVLNEFDRILIPGGRAAISVRLGISEGFKTQGSIGGSRWFSRWTPDEFEAELGRAALSAVSRSHRRLPSGAEWFTVFCVKT